MMSNGFARPVTNLRMNSVLWPRTSWRYGILLLLTAGTILEPGSAMVPATATAAATDVALNPDNCVETILALDVDSSNRVELEELQPLVDRTFASCPLLSGFDVSGVARFCSVLWERCGDGGNSNVDIAAPPAGDTEEEEDTEVTLVSSTPERGVEPVSASPTGEQTGSACSSGMRCNKWFLIGGPILLGLVLGLLLGLVYIETRGGWREKFPQTPRRALPDDDDTSWNSDQVSMIPVTEEDAPIFHDAGVVAHDVENPPTSQHQAAVLFVRSHSLSRQPHAEVMETLPEADDEDASEMMLSDAVSHGDNDSAAFSDMYSDTTPLHTNISKFESTKPMGDLDDVSTTSSSSSISLCMDEDRVEDPNKPTDVPASKYPRATTTERNATVSTAAPAEVKVQRFTPKFVAKDDLQELEVISNTKLRIVKSTETRSEPAVPRAFTLQRVASERIRKPDTTADLRASLKTSSSSGDLTQDYIEAWQNFQSEMISL